MGTFDSMYSALSGMNANSLAISVVGDNLANLNTIGYKSSRVTFQDVLGQTMIGSMGSQQLGQGVSVGSIDQMHTQGGFEATGSVTDMAISGNGFFVVRDAGGTAESQYYTRAGQFLLDNQGNLVTPAGLRVQGYTADATGALGSALGDINLEGATWPATATEDVSMKLSLPADAQAAEGGMYDPADPTSYAHQTSVTVYDSLGNDHQVQIQFEKVDGSSDWIWHAVQPEDDGLGGTMWNEVGTGTLTFNENGQLDDGLGSFTIEPGGGAAGNQLVTIDFGSGATGTTIGALPFGVRSLSQDGSGGGTLDAITVTEDGSIRGTFSNGKSRDLAQVALAIFDSPQGLERQGGNLWARSVESGEPLIGAAGQGGRGQILASHLEGSNVDITQEFVRMIAAQRGFQASSRTITTVDQLLNEAINLKR